MSGNVSLNTVRNGLVLSLDAANPKSFVSGSVSWYDLTTNGFIGTLTNGPTFSSSNGGNIVFDGVDDSITNSTLTLTNLLAGSTTFTITVWINPTNLNATNTSGTGYKTLFDTPSRQLSLWMGLSGNGQFYGLGGGSNTYGTNFNWENNKWQMVTVVCGASTGLIVKNGYEITQSVSKQSTYTQQITFGSNVSSGGSSMQGGYASILFYNRVLSSDEIVQNYNATKTRFGLT